MKATIRTAIAYLRCVGGRHRWVTYQVTHPSVASLNGWRLHCGDCGVPGSWFADE